MYCLCLHLLLRLTGRVFVGAVEFDPLDWRLRLRRQRVRGFMASLSEIPGPGILTSNACSEHGR